MTIPQSLISYTRDHPIMHHYRERVPSFLRFQVVDNFFHVSHMIAFLYSLPENFHFTDIMKSLEVKRGFRLKMQFQEKIPSSWPLIVVANHPHILVDQFSLWSLLELARPKSEIRVITDNVPDGFDSIYPFSEKVGKTPEEKSQFRKNINTLLQNNGTLIVFPSGKLTYRNWITGMTIEDRWRTGAIHFAQYNGCPILPVYISSKTTFIYNLFSNFCSRAYMQNLNFRQALKKEMYIGLTVWNPIFSVDSNITGESLRDSVYELWDESYILMKR